MKKTRYFQEVAAEAEEQGELKGKLKSVPGLLKLGLTVEQIAGALELDVKLVQQAATNIPNDENRPLYRSNPQNKFYLKIRRSFKI